MLWVSILGSSFLLYLYSLLRDLIQFHSSNTISMSNFYLQPGPRPQWTLHPTCLLDIFTNRHLKLDAYKYELLDLFFAPAIQSLVFLISVNPTLNFWSLKWKILGSLLSPHFSHSYPSISKYCWCYFGNKSRIWPLWDLCHYLQSLLNSSQCFCTEYLELS